MNKVIEKIENLKNEKLIKERERLQEAYNEAKMPRQDKDEDVMVVSYDKGFQNERSCLLVGYNSKGNLYIENKFIGYEADMIYKLLKREAAVYDIMK